MEAKLYGQNKGGMSINGIIKNYYAYAGENISAGDLVEYVNGVAGKTDYGESADTAIDNTNTHTGYAISAVALDENRVFIAHCYSSSWYLYGIVVTIDGATITCGTDTKILAVARAGWVISACLLPNGNVFIANDYSSSDYLYGTVVKINGTTVSVSDNYALASSNYAGRAISVCPLPNGNVFIAHSYGSNMYLYGMVVTIDDTTIIKGTDTALVSTTNAGSAISTCLLPNGNVFIAHSYGSDKILYGIVCTISGITITKGSDTKLSSSTTTANNVKALLLPSGKIFVAHSKSAYAQLYALICTVSGTSITYGEDFFISSANYSAIGMSLALLQNNNVLIAHKDSNNNSSLYGIICEVEDTTITQGADTQLNASLYMGDVTSTLFLENGTIFVAHSNSTSYYLNAQIFAIDYDNNIPINQITVTEYETQVRKTTTGLFDGIAKTSGEGSPEFVEGEVKKTGNIFPTTWTQVVEGTKYSSSDGYILESNSYEDADYKVCNLSDLYNDGTVNSGSAWRVDPYLETNNHWASITCPKPTKITKMKTYFNGNTYSYTIRTQIQGKKNSSEDWVDLATLINGDAAYIETTLSNTDFYDQYRLYVTVPDNFWNEARFSFFVWEVLEYVEKEQVPSTEHNEMVSIWTKE